MPFVPLEKPSSGFPRVSPGEQASRDADAAMILSQEYEQPMPGESRRALENEFRQRFGKEISGQPRGFIPLAQGANSAQARGFVPLQTDSKRPSMLKQIALENPAAAIAEAGLNLATTGVALPFAGLAGLAVSAGNALGLTERSGADTVNDVAEAMTYQPRGEMGKAAAGIVAYPFEKLHEGATYAGEKTLEATDSPAVAAAVHTLIEGVAPLVVGPAVKKGRAALKERGAEKPADVDATTARTSEDGGFAPLETGDVGAIREGGRNVEAVETGVQRLADHDSALHRPGSERLEVLRGSGDQSVPAVAGEFQALPGRHGAGAESSALAGAFERERPLRTGELRMDDASRAVVPEGELPDGGTGRAAHDHRGGVEGLEHRYAPVPTADHGAGAIRAGGREVRSPAETERPLADARRGDFDGEPVEPAAQVAANAAPEKAVRGVADRSDIEAGTATKPNAEPLRADIDQAAHEAASSPRNDKPLPTPAQIEAGNFAKGHVRLHGLDIAIENPKGSIRSGVSPEGKAWKTSMQDHYGYVKRTTGKDGDAIDVFIADKPESQRVFLVDQIDPRTGKFDEHKAVLGAESLDDAKAIYHRNYEPGWKGAGAITEMSMPEFKAWIHEGNARKPMAIPKVAGKLVTELPDSLLAKMTAGSGPLAAAGRARTLVEAESARRGMVGKGAAEPRTEIGREARKLREGLEFRQKRDGESGTAYSFAPGAQYVGFIDDSKATASKASAAGRKPPVRREDIIVPFAKELGASIYTGRVKMKNALGFFRRGNEEVRIKRHADIETTAHEMAHLIDSRVPALSAEWKRNEKLSKELKSVSYDHKSVTEGFAEAVRLWMTQPEVLQQRAPLAYSWLENFTQTDKRYGPAMRKAQEGMTGWFGQDAVDRARSKIGDHRPLSDAMNGALDRFRQSVSDDLHGVYRMERELRGGKLEPVGAYESARLSRASASIADGAVRFGYPVKNADGSFSYQGKGLQQILEPVGKNLDDALLYFVGRSAQELMLQGREHLFTKGEIRGMLALETPEARKAFAEYQAWNRGVLDFAEAQGVLNGESRRKWKRVEYLPFHRVQQPGGLKGKPGDWQGIQALTGGTENIKDVLGNMIGNAAQLIDVAVKNEARLKIAELASKPGGGRFMAKIDPGSRPVKVGGDQVLKEMFEKYGIAIDGDAPAFFEFMIHGQPPAGGNVVAVLRDGKPIWYEVADPVLLRSLQSIDRPPMPWLTRWLGMPKRVGQATITMTPDFMLANIARDTIMASVMSRAGFRPVIDSLQGMRLRMTSDPLYKDFIANGGGLSSIFTDEGKVRAKLEKFYHDQGIDARAVLDAPDKLISAIETIADAFEVSSRIGEYKRAIERGEHPRHAAYLGREVSADFAMRGDSKALGFMYDTVIFMKAAVVSWDRLARGVAHDPNKAAIGAKAALLALSSAGLYLLNRDNPRYQDLPDWQKDSYWHFFVPTPDGTEKHFMYPKIWEIGALSSMAERTTGTLLDDDPNGLGKDFARIIGHTFNLNMMPQIVAPLYEQATNRNSFTKTPIETPGMENVQPFLRAKPNTSETIKALGMATRDLPESLQVPPARAEALLRGYLNTWAMYGLMLSDQAFFGDKLPEMRTDQMPVVRRFYQDEPARGTKFESQFYDMLGEAKRLQGTLRELDRRSLPDIADQKEQSPLAGEAKPLERANKKLQEINAEMKNVRRATDLSPAEKRQKLDALTVERNALLKAAVQDAQAAQKTRGE